MSPPAVRVLIVDDSALSREMITDQLRGADGIELLGAAHDGPSALEKVVKLRPDVITLDVQMPGMDGFEVLDRLLEKDPVPVIMVSSFTERGADATLRALDRGAMDYVAKPTATALADATFGLELSGKIRAMAGADVRHVLRIRKARAQRRAGEMAASVAADIPGGFHTACIAIGISTGGPPALSGLFAALRPPLPPIVVVQHMPPAFTGPFARRLDTLSAVEVKEAEPGDVLRPNHAFVAPGGRHLRLQRRGSQVFLRVVDGEPVSGHRPSVDVMMIDAADTFGDRCLGLIMTGMGHDGADGCAAIRRRGGYVLGQDEATSDVYGMNKVAFVRGNVDRQFGLTQLPDLLAEQTRKRFTSAPEPAR